MNAGPPSHVVVPGVRYRATPLYAEPRRLDNLARFFYDEVLPRETRLDRLRRLFGLPERIIDEILADLIRLHYAALDVSAQRIIRVENSSPRPGYYSGTDVEFWQDSVTGVVMRYRDIPSSYRTPRDELTFALEARTLDEGHDFRTCAGARLVEMLQTTAAKMVSQIDGATLETIIGRTFVAQEPLLIPILRTRIDNDEEIAYVHAPELTTLMTRVWSIEVNHHLGSKGSPYRWRMSPSGDDSADPTIWENVRLGASVQQFLSAVRDVGEHRTTQDLSVPRGRFDQQRDELLNRIQSMGTVEHCKSNSDSSGHIRQLWTRAARYLLLVVQEVDEALVRSVSDMLGASQEWNASLIIVEREPGMFARALTRGITPDLLQIVCLPELPFSFSMCVRDGVEVRFGFPHELRGSDPVIRICGGPVPSSLAGRVMASLPRSPGVVFLEERLAAGDAIDARRRAVSEYKECFRFQQESVDRVRRIGFQLARGLKLLEAEWKEHRDQQWKKDLSDAGMSDPTGPSSSEEAVPRTVSEVELKLAHDCDQLRESTSRIPSPLARYLEIGGISAFDVLVEVGRAARVHKSRHILITFTQCVSIGDDTSVWFLGEIVRLGIDVELYLSPIASDSGVARWDRGALDALRRLGDRPEFYRLKWTRGRFVIPSAIVVDDEFVVLGQQSWFESSPGRGFFVAVEARHLAAEIRALASPERA